MPWRSCLTAGHSMAAVCQKLWHCKPCHCSRQRGNLGCAGHVKLLALQQNLLETRRARSQHQGSCAVQIRYLAADRLCPAGMCALATLTSNDSHDGATLLMQGAEPLAEERHHLSIHKTMLSCLVITLVSANGGQHPPCSQFDALLLSRL